MSVTVTYEPRNRPVPNSAPVPDPTDPGPVELFVDEPDVEHDSGWDFDEDAAIARAERSYDRYLDRLG